MVGLWWRSHEPHLRRGRVFGVRRTFRSRAGARILCAMDERTAPRAHALRPLLVGWLPVIAWAGLIFAFSAQPNLRFVPDQNLDFLVRKAGHMGVYGILALLLWRTLAGTIAWRRPWAWALVLTILYAITDEFHQGFVAGRHESALDVGIDAAGALIAVVAVGIIWARRV
jgi:VanZ family protein